MSSANLNRYIKEYLKRQPKTLSMSQIEELVEYDAWLDEHGGLTPRALDGATVFCRQISHLYVDGVCAECGSVEPPRQ